jgi:lipoate-protein ligase B
MNADQLAVGWLGRVPYPAALTLQDALVAARQRDLIGDLLLLLEHPHVYTLGRGASDRFLIAPRQSVPVYRVSRGGEVTYHGPGQLVGYPILALRGSQRDVHAYLRALEQALIDGLGQWAIGAGRRIGLTGVWVGERKIASIGVGIRRWVTLHGFALNVSTDLSRFDAIVPCGIEGCRMTSIREEGPEVGMEEAARVIASSLGAVLGRDCHPLAADRIWSLGEGAGLGGAGDGA